MTVLLLGGTRLGRLLAQRLVDDGWPVTSSLAGRTSDRQVPVGEVRVGGFGGTEGLVSWLQQHRVQAVVDVTHPFAATMTGHAVAACRETRVPYLRLGRPSWRDHPDAAGWHWVADHDQACRAAGQVGSPVLLTVGRQALWHYHLLPAPVVARVADVADERFPAGWRVIQARGPFPLPDERALLRDMNVLVSKDSGGEDGAAKLQAAAELGVAVVMVSRPELPGPEVTSSDEVMAWLAGLPSLG